MRRLTIQAPLDSFTSYGITFQKIFFALKKRGIHVSIRPTKIQTPFGTRIPSEMTAAIVNGPQPEPWEVLFGPTIHLPTPGKKTFYWTTHEGEIPQAGLDLLDQAEVVMMMNKDMARRYTTHVVTKMHANITRVPRMVGCLPLGVDTDVFKPTPVPMVGFCNFGTAGRLAHGWHRKGVDRVIKAFQEEFDSPDDAVRLMVKLHPDCALDDPCDPRIQIIRTHFRETEIVQFLHNLRCYVSGASYEGFGLWPLQAMACGRPVIAMKDSGLDYVQDDTVCVFTAKDDADLRMNMRLVYSDDYTRETLHETADACVTTAQRWSLDKAVDCFVQELETCGALEPVSLSEAVTSAWSAFADIVTGFISKAKVPQNSFQIVHAFSHYRMAEAEWNRVEMAQATWTLDIHHRRLENQDLPREFRDEHRAVPYVKDMIDAVAPLCRPSDIILLTNSDICFMHGLGDRLIEWMTEHPGAIFPRRQFARLAAPIENSRIMEGQRQPGWDGFAFTLSWWMDNRDRMPDMLLGAEAWDSVLATLIGNDNELDGCMYHVEHVPMWKDGRFTLSSQRYNRALARRFFKQEGVASPVDPEPVAEVPQNLV